MSSTTKERWPRGAALWLSSAPPAVSDGFPEMWQLQDGCPWKKWWPWKWPWAMLSDRSDTNLWHPCNSRKASNSNNVGNNKDPSSNRNASFKQGTPAREATASTAKTPATAGSVWKNYKKRGRTWSQKYGCECGCECGHLKPLLFCNTSIIIR